MQFRKLAVTYFNRTNFEIWDSASVGQQAVDSPNYRTEHLRTTIQFGIAKSWGYLFKDCITLRFFDDIIIEEDEGKSKKNQPDNKN